jgi:ABC-2 type transport system ATP-binding protein
MTASTSAIEVNGISKTFKSTMARQPIKALIDVDLEVNRGEIFGLLGPNGAGKTTFMKILLGSLRASSGTAQINGLSIDNPQARHKVGFLPENHRFPLYQTGLQMLNCFGGLAGMSRTAIKEKSKPLLDLVRMSDWAGTKIKKYSKGMMQRLGLAQALLNDPDIVFLDEPTDGVDPVGRHEIREILKSLKREGKTVFLNSHLLAEVEAVCDRVAVLNRGRVIKVGPADGLIDIKPAFEVRTAGFESEIGSMVTEENPNARIEGNNIQITYENESDINNLIDLLRDNGVDILAVIPKKISLEDSFIQLIRGQDHDE